MQSFKHPLNIYNFFFKYINIRSSSSREVKSSMFYIFISNLKETILATFKMKNKTITTSQVLTFLFKQQRLKTCWTPYFSFEIAVLMADEI